MKAKPLRVTPGKVLHECLSDEIAQWRSQWVSAFGQDSEGINADAFLWHVFSSGRYPSASGEEARAQYRLHAAHEYVILSNDRKAAFTTDLRPESCSLFDYYVFPRNLAWTMAFTHEDGWLGPYFARHGNYKNLELANATRLRKEQEAVAARQKGWR